MSHARNYKIGKTWYTYMAFVGFGLTMSLSGPSVPDLCDYMEVTAEQLSVAYSVASAMWTIGSILFGPVLDRFQKQADLFLGIALGTSAVCTLIKPYTPHLWLYIAATAVEALAFAGIALSCNVLVFSLWGKHSSAPVQGLHAAWGVGWAFGPLVIRPFLGPDKEAYPMENITSSINTTFESGIGLMSGAESHIEVAYIISACLMLALSAISIILYNNGIPDNVTIHLKEKKSFKSVFSIKEISCGDTKFGVQILVLFTLFYIWNCGRESIFGYWLFNYAVESKLQFTKQEAALLDAAAKFSFLGGRIIAALLAIKLPVQPMIITEIYVVLLFTICLGMFGSQAKVYLYVFACLCNVFSAPIWSACLAWTDRYIIVSGVVFTLMDLGAGIGGFTFVYLTGWLFTNRDANAVMYVLFACAVLLCILIAIMQVLASKHGDRFKIKDTRHDASDRCKANEKNTALTDL